MLGRKMVRNDVAISKAQEKIWQIKRDALKEIVAEQLHNKYEELSKKENWITQRTCQVGFKDLPEENKRVMLGLADFVLDLRKLKDYEIINNEEMEVKKHYD